MLGEGGWRARLVQGSQLWGCLRSPWCLPPSPDRCRGDVVCLRVRSVQPQCCLVTDDRGEVEMTLDELQVREVALGPRKGW